MGQAMYYSLSLPVSTVTIGCDSSRDWNTTYNWHRELTPLNQQEMLALNAKAQSASKQGLCSFVPTAEPKNRGGQNLHHRLTLNDN